MNFCRKKIAILMVMATVILVSGCVSPSGNTLSPEEAIVNPSPALPAMQGTPNPSYRITINPVGNIPVGSYFTATGTTSLPPGSEIAIRAKLLYEYDCPPPPVRKPITPVPGRHVLCDGSCGETEVRSTATVMAGPEGNNTWSGIINTTSWCPHESYGIRAGVNNHMNVSEGYRELRYGD